MLKKIRITFFVVALISFAGWWMIRKPYSPSDELVQVYYPAFEVKGLSAEKGKSLASAVASWNGITAASYNPSSQLLSVACYAGTDETALVQTIAKNAGVPVSKKIFQEIAGPKCPVPLDTLAKLPYYLLLVSYLCVVSALLTFIPSFSKKRFIIHEKHA